MSALALLVVMAGGAVAAAGVTGVSRPADVQARAVRVDVELLVNPPAVGDPMHAAAAVLNGERTELGLAPLEWHDLVAQAAQLHSEDQASIRTMQHAGSDGSRAGDRLTRVGFTWGKYGEAVAAGQRTPEEVIAAWLNSPGHRAILLGDYRHVGVGYATDSRGTPYWTLVAAS